MRLTAHQKALRANEKVLRALKLGLTTDASKIDSHIVRRNLGPLTKKSYQGTIVLWNA